MGAHPLSLFCRSPPPCNRSSMHIVKPQAGPIPRFATVASPPFSAHPRLRHLLYSSPRSSILAPITPAPRRQHPRVAPPFLCSPRALLFARSHDPTGSNNRFIHRPTPVPYPKNSPCSCSAPRIQTLVRHPPPPPRANPIATATVERPPHFASRNPPASHRSEQSSPSTRRPRSQRFLRIRHPKRHNGRRLAVPNDSLPIPKSPLGYARLYPGTRNWGASFPNRARQRGQPQPRLGDSTQSLQSPNDPKTAQTPPKTHANRFPEIHTLHAAD